MAVDAAREGVAAAAWVSTRCAACAACAAWGGWASGSHAPVCRKQASESGAAVAPFHRSQSAF